jgi:hypothetical protein
LKPFDHDDRLAPVTRLADNLHLAALLEHGTRQLAQLGNVIADDDRYRLAHFFSS